MTQIDPVDELLIDRLREDARASYTKLGAAVGLSADAVRARVDRLIQTATIRPTTLIDPAVFGLSTRGTMALTFRGDDTELAVWARDQDNVMHLTRVVGRFSHLVDVVASSMEDLFTIAYGRLAGMPGVSGIDVWPNARIDKWGLSTGRPRIGADLAQPTEIELADGDRAILRELVDDPRVSFTDLAARTDRSYPAVRRRVIALLEAGVARTTVTTDQLQTSDVKPAFFMVRGTSPQVLEALMAHDAVKILVTTTGSVAHTGEVHAASLTEMLAVGAEITAGQDAQMEFLPYASVLKLPGSLSFRHDLSSITAEA